MIRFIAALDNQRGIANEQGIPWQGKVPTDVLYYHEKIRGHVTIMGYGMYIELSKPLVNPTNYVASTGDEELRDGFILVKDAQSFLRNASEDVWVLGGALLFTTTLPLADELYITQLQTDFNCTKFFPEYKNDFQLVNESQPIIENGITYTLQVWKRKRL